MTDELLKEKGEISTKENLREQDVLLATGEQITIAKLSMCLSDLGYKAISLLGWQVPIITDSNYGDANVIDIKTDRILKELKEEKSNFKNESPECIAIDKKGGVWVGTSGVGLFKYNPQKDAFEQYLEDRNGHSLANKNIMSMCLRDDDTAILAIHEG